MSDAEAEAFRLAFEVNRSREEWFAFALIVGLVGEVVVALWFRENRPRLEVGLAVGLAGLVAVAVWGEVLFGNRADDAADALKRASDEKVVALEAANLELERLLQPRRLTPDQAKSLARTMAAWPGQQAEIIGETGDLEAYRLASQIWQAPSEAQWVVVPSFAGRISTSMPVIGVSVLAENDPATLEAMAAFVETLRADGITDVTPRLGEAPPQGRAGRIQIGSARNHFRSSSRGPARDRPAQHHPLHARHKTRFQNRPRRAPLRVTAWQCLGKCRISSTLLGYHPQHPSDACALASTGFDTRASE